jgi:hypothetical protein
MPRGRPKNPAKTKGAQIEGQHLRRALERAEVGKPIYGDKEVIEKFNQVRDLAIDELKRRLEEDAKEIPVFNLVGIIDTIIKNSNLVQGKATDIHDLNLNPTESVVMALYKVEKDAKLKGINDSNSRIKDLTTGKNQ